VFETTALCPIRRTNEPRERNERKGRKKGRQENPDVRQHLSRVASIFASKRVSLEREKKREREKPSAVRP